MAPDDLAILAERLRSVPDPAAFLASLFAAAPVGFQVLGRDGRPLMANQAYRDVFGARDETSAPASGSRLDEALARAFRGEIVEMPADWYEPGRAGALGTTAERRLRLEATVLPLRDGGGGVTHAALVVRDVTSHALAQEEAARREAEMRRLFESSMFGIFFWEPAGGITEANDELLRLLGHTREELEQGRVRWSDLTPPDQAAKDLRAFEELADLGRCTPYEKEFELRDGRRVPVLVGGATLEGGRGIAFVVDLTQRRALEDRLAQAQKMEAIGRLAGGIAHDFNNALAAILGFSSLGLAESAPGDPHAETFKLIATAADRAAALTRQLMAVSRQQPVRPRVVDVAAQLADMQPRVRQLVGDRVALTVISDADVPRVRIDPVQLEQVVSNLATNARDAMPSGGHLTVQASRGSLDGCACLVLHVRDTGEGMSEEVRARAFEPFFTTKASGLGTGLGLATVFGIVSQCGGRIEVASLPGRGTTFRVLVPATDAPADASAGDGDGTRVPARAGTVLLAEDDGIVRAFVKRALERDGHRVLEAGDGVQALAAARAHAGRIDVLVTDVIMPNLDGRRLAEELLADRPGTPVVFISGFTDDDFVRSASSPGMRFLQKPLTIEALSTAVREACAGA